MRKWKLLAGVLTTLAVSGSANATLNVFKSYVGTYGLSTDGGGSTASSYAVSAFVPLGATVTAAYLYQSNVNGVASVQPVSLNGSALSFSAYSYNPTNSLGSARSDVTSIVSSVVNGGAGGTYNFTVNEGNSSATDGVALAVVYSLPSLAISTVALLDGYSASGGDATALNFSTPLNPSDPAFFAEMRLGIGYSCCTSSANQFSTIDVNGTTITRAAGNNDDSGQDANGALITVGGNDDPYSTLLPTYANDHERYNLAPYVKAGDTSIQIKTTNPSYDDNIFLAAFRVFGSAGVNAPPPSSSVPEPASWMMMISGFGLVGGTMRARRRTVTFA